MNDAADAIRAGKPVILPTDTVYGLVRVGATARQPTERLYELKGRDLRSRRRSSPPTSRCCFECAARAARPRRRDRARAAAGAVHADPPESGAPLSAGSRATNPDAIGVRVPELPDAVGSHPRRRSAASSRRARTCPAGPIRGASRRFRPRSSSRSRRSSTPASCRGRRRRSSTSPAPSRGSCARAPRLRRRLSTAFGRTRVKSQPAGVAASPRRCVRGRDRHGLAADVSGRVRGAHLERVAARCARRPGEGVRRRVHARPRAGR